jgi:hypothetical protein
MKWTKRKIVFKESGENAGTISAYSFLEDFTGDLQEKTYKFFSADIDQYIEVDLYQVREICIPEPWTWEDYQRRGTKLRFAVALCEGVEPLKGFTQIELEAFLSLDEEDKYILGQLWAKKDKSEFLQSLYAQMLEYIRTLSQGERPKYKTPLSGGQYKALAKFRIWIGEAKKISNSVYWDKKHARYEN